MLRLVLIKKDRGVGMTEVCAHIHNQATEPVIQQLSNGERTL